MYHLPSSGMNDTSSPPSTILNCTLKLYHNPAYYIHKNKMVIQIVKKVEDALVYLSLVLISNLEFLIPPLTNPSQFNIL
jgi:hypothetical protein